MDDSYLLDRIHHIRNAIHGEEMWVREAMNGALMGSDIESGNDIDVEYRIAGRDEIESVEVVQDGVVVHRSYAEEAVTMENTLASSFQIRLEWGWGPWASLDLDRITDWELKLEVSKGKITKQGQEGQDLTHACYSACYAGSAGLVLAWRSCRSLSPRSNSPQVLDILTLAATV